MLEEITLGGADALDDEVFGFAGRRRKQQPAGDASFTMKEDAVSSRVSGLPMAIDSDSDVRIVLRDSIGT